MSRPMLLRVRRRAAAVAVFGVAAALGACTLLVNTSDLDQGGASPPSMPVEAAAQAGDGGVPNDASGRPCPSAPIPDLLAWYPFDEPDGTDIAIDCSGVGRDGMLLPTSKLAHAPGHTGRAMDFDGTSCFDLGLAADLAYAGSPRTVAAWIRPRTLSLGGNPRAFFSHYFNAGQSEGWWMATDEQTLLELKMFPLDAGFQQNENTIATDRWVHVVGVLVPNEMIVYIDGALKKKLTPAKAAAVNPLAHGYLGCAAGRFYFDGLVDDLRLYGRALTAEEVATLASK